MYIYIYTHTYIHTYTHVQVSSPAARSPRSTCRCHPRACALLAIGIVHLLHDVYAALPLSFLPFSLLLPPYR